MIDSKEVQKKIVDIIQNKGPSLPIQIAKILNMNSLFASAFLSELSQEKRIKVSHLKVGGSPLYFLQGQEPLLENFSKFLNSKELEAFSLLKEKKILKDSGQEPAIRVALRSIRDFAIAFKDNEDIFWRYNSVPETEVIEIFKKTKQETIEIKNEIIAEQPKQDIKEKPKKTRKKQEPKIIEDKIIEQTPGFQNPLAKTTIIKKEKPKSEFVLKIIEFANKNFKLIQEKEYKSREYTCIVQANSDFGPINFLTHAKDKKTISEKDLKNLLSTAQSIPLPALLIYTENLSKKAIEYENKYSSILKTRKIS
jgi:hypothetical protein